MFWPLIAPFPQTEQVFATASSPEIYVFCPRRSAADLTNECGGPAQAV
jgi:hypothetical protein